MRQRQAIMMGRASRRSVLKGGVAAAGAATLGTGLIGAAPAAFAQDTGPLSKGDIAILRFLAAAEIIETDLWRQYNELAGVHGGNPAYKEAIEVLDEDMPQYITDNTDDEVSHKNFLNAYLVAKGQEAVNLDAFRTLPSSKATGAKQVGRLTNLQRLTVDTSWWTRYRSMENPDFGAKFPQVVNIVNRPAIPRSDADLTNSTHLQAIANTAAFHFGFIEQGGTSLYAAMAQKASNLQVLQIIISIGGVEVAHFQTWHDKAGNAPPLNDNGLIFPDFEKPPFTGELFNKSKIMPEPCEFISPNLPLCSVIRPTSPNGAATAAANSLVQDGLFIGQSQLFLILLRHLAEEADAAERRF